MRLQKAGNEILMAFDPWKQLMFVGVVFLWILGWFAISIVTFLRRNFGERYLSWINLFFGYTVVANFAFLGNVIGASLGFGFSKITMMVWGAFIAMSVYHHIVIRRRNRAGIPWHSLYSGTSWLLPLADRLRFSEETLHKWLEPGLALTFGALFWGFDRTFSLWLLVSAAALLVHEHLAYYLQRQRIFDATDAQLESEYMEAVRAGRRADETAGFTIAMSSIELMDRADAAFQAKEMGVEDAMAGLDPQMREFVSQPHDQEPFSGNSEAHSA